VQARPIIDKSLHQTLEFPFGKSKRIYRIAGSLLDHCPILLGRVLALLEFGGISNCETQYFFVSETQLVSSLLMCDETCSEFHCW